MNSIELIIVSVYALTVIPALLLPLFWAAVLDGRYQAARTRRARSNGSQIVTVARNGFQRALLRRSA